MIVRADDIRNSSSYQIVKEQHRFSVNGMTEQGYFDLELQSLYGVCFSAFRVLKS
jgi:hypothetical protein